MLFALAAWFAFAWWRRRAIPRTRWFLRAAAVAGVASVVCMEAGWVVTEVGRQPWIVYQVQRTADAVTRSDGIWVIFGVTFFVYSFVIAATVLVLQSMARRWRTADADEPTVPYGPSPELPVPEESASGRARVS